MKIFYQNAYVKISDFCLQISLLISDKYEYETIESEYPPNPNNI